MNIVFNESDFGAPTLPKVLIDSVTLYHGTTGVYHSKQDPHITHPDEMQAINVVEFKDFNNEEYGDMNVVLDLNFLYPLENDFGSANVLFNSELINYIDVNLVQCRHRPIADLISKDPNKYLNPFTGVYNPIVNPNVEDFVKSNLVFKSTSFGHSFKQFYALISNELNKEAITAAGYADLGVSTTLPFEKIKTADGIEYYSIPFKMDFTIPASAGGTNPQHLSYFAFCSLNKEGTLNVGGSAGLAGIVEILDTSFETIIPDDVLSKIGMGETFYDIIINNNELYDKSYYFRDGTGIMYVGPSHQMLDGQWMKGTDHPGLGMVSDSDYLTRVPVPNIKVKDYRQGNKLENYHFDFNRTSGYILNDHSLLMLLENTKTKSIMEKKNTSFFSELKMSRDSNGANRFLFHMDMKEIIMANTLFPELLESLEAKNPNEFKSLISNALITDFKIIRTQIKQEQVISNSGQNAVFSKYEQPHVVVVSSDDSNGKLLTAEYDESRFYKQFNGLNGLELSLINSEANAGTISEIKVKQYNSSATLRNLGKRTFTGVDYGVTARNGGKFQYSAHLKITDPVLNYIKKKRDIMEVCVASMVPLIEDLSRPEFSDMYSDRFNEAAYDFYIENYGVDFLSSNVYEFLKALFCSTPENQDPQSVNLSFLISIAHPAVGSISGLLYLNKLMSDFVQKLSKVLASSMSIPKSLDFSSKSIGIEPSPYLVEQPNLTSPTQNRIYTLEHSFKEFFDNSIAPGFGYDFLSLNIQESFNGASFSTEGLKTFSSSRIGDRFNRETEKLFNVSSNSNSSLTFSLDAKVTGGNAGSEGTKVILNPADTIANKKYAYLSPSVVRLPNQGSFDSLASSAMNNAQLYTFLMTDIYGINQQGTAYHNAMVENSYIVDSANDDDMSTEQQLHRMELISILEKKGGTIETKEGITKANYSGEPESSQNKTTPFTNGVKFGFIDSDTFMNPLAVGDTDTMTIDLIAASISNYKTGVKNLLNTGINTNRLVNSIIMIDDFGMLKKYDTSLGTVFNGIEFYRINTVTGGLTFKQEYHNAKNLSDTVQQASGEQSAAGQMQSDAYKGSNLNSQFGLYNSFGGPAPSSQTAQGPGTAGPQGMPTSPGNYSNPILAGAAIPPPRKTAFGIAPYQLPSAGSITPASLGGFRVPESISDVATLIAGSYNSEGGQIFYPLKNAPNHVKALLIYGTSAKKTNILAKANPILTALDNNQDPFRSSDVYSYIMMNYKVINKIEVFRGFGHSNCVQASEFSELTSEDLYDIEYNPDELILCRQRKYLKQAYNVSNTESINIPLLDEYFLIRPANVGSATLPKLPDGLLSDLLNKKSGITNYLNGGVAKAGFLGNLLTPPAAEPGSLAAIPEKAPSDRLKERNAARASGIVDRLTGKTGPRPKVKLPGSKYDSATDPISTDNRDETGAARSEPNISDRRRVPRRPTSRGRTVDRTRRGY